MSLPTEGLLPILSTHTFERYPELTIHEISSPHTNSFLLGDVKFIVQPFLVSGVSYQIRYLIPTYRRQRL